MVAYLSASFLSRQLKTEWFQLPQYVHLGVEQYSFVWPVSPQIVHMYGRWFVDVLPPRPLPLPRDGIAEAVVPLVVLAWDPLLDASYWVA